MLFSESPAKGNGIIMIGLHGAILVTNLVAVVKPVFPVPDVAQ